MLHTRPVRAAVLYGKEDVRVEEVAPRPLAPGEVRIAIEAALTCGTDLKVFKRGYHAKMIRPPAVFGHELAGVICEVGAPLNPSLPLDLSPEHPSPALRAPSPLVGRGERDGVRGGRSGSGEQSEVTMQWRIGERVVVANSAPCGECGLCRGGQENLCDDLLFLNGAYAESIVVPARLVQKNLLRLKPATSFRDAALTEPLACVVQGVEDSQLRAGQRVLVIGAGPIGLMFVALAKHLGCDVTAAGRGAKRLETATKLGAVSVDVGDGKNVESELAARGTAAFDMVIDAVGKPEVWESATRLVRKGGLVNFFGGCPSGTSVSLDTGLLHYSGLTLKASFHHTPRTIRRALGFIEDGVIRADDFVDGECGLRELPALFASMASGNRVVKSHIDVKR